MIEDLSNLLVDRGVTTYEALDIIKDTFKQIEITEEVIEKWRDHENFRVINASLKPYHSELYLRIVQIGWPEIMRKK